MMFSPGVLFTFSLISLSVQQQDRDPLKDFCRIFGHQTAVVDRNLLIDGGLVNWGPITTESENYTSQSDWA
jgi:phage tail protein X